MYVGKDCAPRLARGISGEGFALGLARDMGWERAVRRGLARDVRGESHVTGLACDIGRERAMRRALPAIYAGQLCTPEVALHSPGRRLARLAIGVFWQRKKMN